MHFIAAAGREEMSSAPIPKREHHDLLSELFSDLPDLCEFDCLNGRADDILTTPEPTATQPDSIPLNTPATAKSQPIEIQSIEIIPPSTLSQPSAPLFIAAPVNYSSITQLVPATPVFSAPYPLHTFIPQFLPVPVTASVGKIIVSDVTPEPKPQPIVNLTPQKTTNDANHSTRYQKELYKRLENDQPVDYVSRIYN